MPYERDPQNIARSVRAVVDASGATRSRLQDQNYQIEDLIAEVESKSGSIWENIADDIRRYDTIESDVEAARAHWQASLEPEPKPADIARPGLDSLQTWLGSALGLYGTFLSGFAIYRIYRGWGSLWAGLTSLWTWGAVLLYLLPVVICIFILGWVDIRRNKLTAGEGADLKRQHAEWEQRNEAARTSSGVTDKESQRDDQAKLLDARLAEQVEIQVNLAINRRTEPSYLPVFDVMVPRGFGEVSGSRTFIETPARKSLEFLLNNLSGGSIGIAGSRGAGKTTLLRNFCGPNRIIEKLKDKDTGEEKDVLGILVSAPVAYQARDFLLYLFVTACQAVIVKEGGELIAPDDAKDYALPAAPFRELASIPELQRLPSVLVRFGAWLLAFSLVASLPLALVPKAGDGKAAGAVPATTQAAVAPKPALPYSAAAKPVPAKPAPAAASLLLDPIAFVARWLGVMQVDPGAIGAWGGEAMLLGLVIGEILRGSALVVLAEALPVGGLLRLYPPTRQIIDRRRWEERLEITASDPPPKNLRAEAEGWLKTIKFQQSFTSGWSGSLKLPLGFEGGINRAVTLAQNQLSLPEIAFFFAQFIDEKVAPKYQVLIGIDELDKLATDKLARQFINDIKSIFGLRRCFYLVSVSENAMSSFERRGLPFRDEFDSAFDEMIYVDHLDFKLATKLLQQRVLGRPIPFIALCYCLSGGLPRDLIRSFRRIIELDTGRSTLFEICDRLVTADIGAKVRATGTSVRLISLEPDVNIVLEALHGLELAAGDDRSLEDQAAIMLHAGFPGGNEAGADAPSDGPAAGKASPAGPPRQSADAAAQRQKLRDLVEEIATYVLFVVALRRFFTDALTEAQLTKLTDRFAIDRVAEARRYIGVNPMIARTLIQIFWISHIDDRPPRALSGKPIRLVEAEAKPLADDDKGVAPPAAL